MSSATSPATSAVTSPEFVQALRNLVGHDGVLVGDEVRSRPAGFFRADHLQADMLVRPRNTGQVAAVLRLCHEARQPVVAQGGRTGLVHSGDAAPSELILSMERMAAIEEIDPIQRIAVVQCGVTLQALQEAADEHDLAFPLDLGARGSCTLGGNVSTNAGGNRVIRYGMTRDMVLGLEAVLADGTVMSSMNRMLKNNAAYDLKQLFIGSEGTLGVVTRVVLRLHPRLAPVKAAVLPLLRKDGHPERAEALYKDLRKRWMVEYDESAAIGKRYRRQDEIGTPLCITIDHQTLTDGTVTVRARDSMTQQRIPESQVASYLQDLIGLP